MTLSRALQGYREAIVEPWGCGFVVTRVGFGYILEALVPCK